MSLQAGSDLYYDQETLLELYRQELSTLAQTNELAASLLPALEDLLERQRLYQDALEVGYACVVDLSTGNSFLVSYLRSNDLVFALEMDMSSGKLIQLCGIAELCGNPERGEGGSVGLCNQPGPIPCLTCTAESDQGWAVQYTFLDPEGDGSVLTFQLRLDDLLQLSVTPNEVLPQQALSPCVFQSTRQLPLPWQAPLPENFDPPLHFLEKSSIMNPRLHHVEPWPQRRPTKRSLPMNQRAKHAPAPDADGGEEIP
ncbi:MAG: hypothetical protein ACLSHU_14010 [Oscillospiraceae bacterium]